LRGVDASAEVEGVPGELRKALSLARLGVGVGRSTWILIGCFIAVWIGIGLVYCVSNMNGEHWVDLFTDFGVSTALCTIAVVVIGGFGAMILLGSHVMPNVGFAAGAGTCLFVLTVVFFCVGAYYGTEKLREYHDPPHGASHFHRLPQSYFIGSDPRLAEVTRSTHGSGRVGGVNLDSEVVEGLRNARHTTRL
jgi:hypothetical protein